MHCSEVIAMGKNTERDVLHTAMPLPPLLLFRLPATWNRASRRANGAVSLAAANSQPGRTVRARAHVATVSNEPTERLAGPLPYLGLFERVRGNGDGHLFEQPGKEVADLRLSTSRQFVSITRCSVVYDAILSRLAWYKPARMCHDNVQSHFRSEIHLIFTYSIHTKPVMNSP